MTERLFSSYRFAVTAVAICIVTAVNCVHADLVIVQKVEGSSQSGEMTMKIKGEKARADLSPAVSTIIDATSGDVTTLMHEQKTFMRITAAAARELTVQMKQADVESGRPAPVRPELQPTGKKEKITGYDTLQFVWQTGAMKLTYWIAKDFPHASEILAIMKKMQTGAASLGSGFMPDPMTFPGLPVKTQVDIGGKKVTTTTLISVKEEPVDTALFNIPAGYKETPSPVFHPPKSAEEK